MANIYKKKQLITQSKVFVTLSPELWNIVNKAKLKKVIRQINSLPKPIPKIQDITSRDLIVANTTQSKIQVTKDLSDKTIATGVMHIHIAYQPNEKYGLGNSIGRVFATNSGLIILNDVRLREVAGNPPNPTYLINLIFHEILHVYGIDHSGGLPFNRVKNTPIMNAGKFGFDGLSGDDIAGLRENYDVKIGKRVSLDIKANGSVIGLLNRENNFESQGKNLVAGGAVFPQLMPARYDIYVDDIKVKAINLRKSAMITI
jgi:hypothetical protein